MGLTESPEDLGMDPSISRILGGSCGTQCWLWPSRAHCGVSARGHGETLSLEMSWPGDGCSLRSSESRGSVIFRMGVTRRSWETKRTETWVLAVARPGRMAWMQQYWGEVGGHVRWASTPFSQARDLWSSWAPFCPSFHSLHTQPPGLVLGTTGPLASPAQML